MGKGKGAGEGSCMGKRAGHEGWGRGLGMRAVWGSGLGCGLYRRELGTWARDEEEESGLGKRAREKE